MQRQNILKWYKRVIKRSHKKIDAVVLIKCIQDHILKKF